MSKRITPKSQYEQIERWKKTNMKMVGASYRIEFVQDFKDACEQLNVSQSEVFRKAMQKVINDAKLINR